jgi:hypothetical protein
VLAVLALGTTGLLLFHCDLTIAAEVPISGLLHPHQLGLRVPRSICCAQRDSKDTG